MSFFFFPFIFIFSIRAFNAVANVGLELPRGALSWLGRWGETALWWRGGGDGCGMEREGKRRDRAHRSHTLEHPSQAEVAASCSGSQESWAARSRELNHEVVGAKAALEAGLALSWSKMFLPPSFFFLFSSCKQEAGVSFHPKSLQNVSVFIAAFIYLFLPFVGNRRVCS